MKSSLLTQQNHLFKDYYLVGTILVKQDMIDSKHLLWSKGGVPCVDAGLWERYKEKITKLYFKTRKNKVFTTTKDIFELNKKELDFGFGKQYYIDKDNWTIK